MQIIDDWLEDWLLQASPELEDYAQRSDYGILRRLAARLEDEALAEGFEPAGLRDACAGDAFTFLGTHAVFHLQVPAAPAPGTAWAEAQITPLY